MCVCVCVYVRVCVCVSVCWYVLCYCQQHVRVMFTLLECVNALGLALWPTFKEDGF